MGVNWFMGPLWPERAWNAIVCAFARRPAVLKSNRKPGWSRPLADFVDVCAFPALARHGFGQADIVTLWPEIVGARVARFAEPVRLRRSRPSRGDVREPAVLVVRVDGGFAIELQHIAPVVIERINAHLGWRCVGRLDLRQAPLLGRPPQHRSIAPVGPEAIRRAAMATAGIEDGMLRAALTRLGSRVLGPASPGRAGSPEAATAEI